MLSQAIEDYLKAIYKIAPSSRVGTVELAKYIGVSPASATEMLQKMAKLGLVEYKSHYGAKLTDFGVKAALEVLRNHRLLELFLCETLGYPIEKAHEEACKLEHHISEDLVDRIALALGNPAIDPHGHPIPDKEGFVDKNNACKLSCLKSGETAKVVYIEDLDPNALKKIINAGILPNTHIKIIEDDFRAVCVDLLINDDIVSIDGAYLDLIYVERYN